MKYRYTTQVVLSYKTQDNLGMEKMFGRCLLSVNYVIQFSYPASKLSGSQ